MSGCFYCHCFDILLRLYTSAESSGAESSMSSAVSTFRDSSAAATKPGALSDPQALLSIRNLELRAKIVVEGFWNGLHRSPYHGFSVEFTEYRQ